MNDNPLWTTEQTADFLDFPASTLVRWRRIRVLRASGQPSEVVAEAVAKISGPKLSGPPFIKIGKRQVRYRKDDVIEWAQEPK